MRYLLRDESLDEEIYFDCDEENLENEVMSAISDLALNLNTSDCILFKQIATIKASRVEIVPISETPKKSKKSNKGK